MTFPIDPANNQPFSQVPLNQEEKVEIKVNLESKVVKERCFSCRKNVGLLGIKCRCQYIFCSKHRYPESHGCSFDFKEAQKTQITKDNPLLKEEKIRKI